MNSSGIKERIGVVDKFFQISTLGSNGRWGNQIFQICFGLAMAIKYDRPLQIPSNWCGWDIFDVCDRVIPQNDLFSNAPQTYIDRIPSEDTVNKCKVLDFYGYWQNQRSIDLYSKADVQSWLKFKPWVTEMFARKSSAKRIVVHKRRGDYVRQPNHYCSITDQSFDKAVEQVKAKYGEASVIEITEESPTRNAYCEAFGLDFLADFMLMVNADYLVRSNSTFSLVAGWFSDVKVFAPVVTDKGGWHDVDFVEGNWPRCADSSRHPVELTDLHLRET